MRRNNGQAEIAAIQEAAVNSEDYRAARQAFLEKRTPVLRGGDEGNIVRCTTLIGNRRNALRFAALCIGTW